MREQIERMKTKLARMDVGFSTDAICDLREVLYEVIDLLDTALPKEVEPD